MERLYTFSRAILLIEGADLFPQRLLEKLMEVFALRAAVLYECRTGEFYRAGKPDSEISEDRLRDAALRGTSFSDLQGNSMTVVVRLASEPIASLTLQGPAMPDSVLQGVANLVAIGLERLRTQDLAQQVEAARQSEQLRTTLIDAIAHEFKTPLTLIKGATTALLSSPDEPMESRMEQLAIADEEAEHLRELIDDAVEMARLDTAHIDLHRETSDVAEIVAEVAGSKQDEIDERPLEIVCDGQLPPIGVDRRLLKLALKQLIDNALKYSPADTPVTIRVQGGDGMLTIEITDCGQGIPLQEQTRIFERFYRSPTVKHQIPGSGLGLSIAYGIVHAHNGELTVTSRPGRTTFCMSLPADQTGDRN